MAGKALSKMPMPLKRWAQRAALVNKRKRPSPPTVKLLRKQPRGSRMTGELVALQPGDGPSSHSPVVAHLKISTSWGPSVG